MASIIKKGKGRFSVLRNADGGDCSLGGVSSEKGRITIHSVHLNGMIPTYRDMPTLCKSPELADIPDEDYILCTFKHYSGSPMVAWNIGDGRKHGHTMAGGNFAWTSNQIDRDAIGIEAPISLHDRVECQERYEKVAARSR